MAKTIEVLQYDMLMAPNIKLSPERDKDFGFLKVDITAAVPGVMEYKTKEGRIIKQLLPPETLFDQKSYQTLEDKPLTEEHPKKANGSLLTSKDTTKHQKGHVKQGIRQIGDELVCPVQINDENLINRVLNKEKFEASPGYICVLEEAPSGSMWNGQPYDYIQKQRRYNHLAIVQNARGGPRVRVNIDGEEEECGTIGYMDSVDLTILKQKGVLSMDKLSINLDGVSVEMEKTSAQLVQQLFDKKDEAMRKAAEDMKEMQEKYEDMSKKYDVFKGTADQYKSDMEDMKKKMSDMEEKHKKDMVSVKKDAMSDSAIEERLSILELGKRHIENFDSKGKSNIEIKREILSAKRPCKEGETSVFANASEGYIDGAFTVLKDSLADSIIADTAKKVADAINTVDSSSADVIRAKYIREQQEASNALA
jgi:hypothetical protein